MLGPGASAWSLTAVAGADLDSADVRARNVLSKGDLVLADTHYGVSGRATETTKTIFVGVMVLTQSGADELFGDSTLVGKPIKELAEAWGFDWGGDVRLGRLLHACAAHGVRIGVAELVGRFKLGRQTGGSCSSPS